MTGRPAPPPPRTAAGDATSPGWGPLGTLVGALPVLALCLLPLLAGPEAGAAAPKARCDLILLCDALLVLVALLAWRLSRSPAASLGLAMVPARIVAASALAGALLAGAAVLYGLGLERLAPAACERLRADEARQLAQLAGPWPLVLALALGLGPLAEELFFRGFVFGGLRGRLGIPLAAVLASAFFAASHAMAWAFPPLFLLGLVAAALYARHRSLLAPLALHAAYNAVALGLAASGAWRAGEAGLATALVAGAGR